MNDDAGSTNVPHRIRGPEDLEAEIALATLREQYEEFYRADFKPLVRHVATATNACFEEAEDAAQKAMILAWQAWEGIDHPKAWVRRVAMREFYKEIPRIKAEMATPDAPESGHSPLTEVGFESTEEVIAVGLALRNISVTDRRVLAFVQDEFTSEEMAKELRTTRQAVRQRVSRARKALLKELKKISGGAE